MIFYVTVGGMKGTTWVQIVKAVLLMTGTILITILVLAQFNFNLSELLGAAAQNTGKGEAVLQPGLKYGESLLTKIDFVSLSLALVLGTAGLPHILIRFYTVPTARDARKSVLWAIGLIGAFYLMTLVLGFGAAAMLDRSQVDPVEGGNQNLASPLLAEAVGGGEGSTGGAILLALIAAVAFATILAVVAGLTLAGASAVSHDLYASVFPRGRATDVQEVRVSRIATVVLGIVAIGLGILFEQQNIAFMVGLAFAIAASCNFPILFLSMFWKRLTTRGTLIGGFLGLFSAALLVILSPTVWVAVLGFETAIFPYKDPALFSIIIAFAGIWFFSVTDRSQTARAEEAAFEAQYVRSQTGIGVATAAAH
jgi:cation/acetate symporter